MVLWYGTMVWYYVLCAGTMVWYGMVLWYGMVWYYGMVLWHGTRHGMVWPVRVGDALHAAAEGPPHAAVGRRVGEPIVEHPLRAVGGAII